MQLPIRREKNPITYSDAITQMQKGNFSNVLFDGDWTYYDTYPLVAGKLSYRFFSEAIGQGTPVKTLADTNLDSAGKLPQGHNLKCHVLKIMYLGGSVNKIVDDYPQILNDFLFNTTITVKFTGKNSQGTWKLFEIMGLNQAYTLQHTTVDINVQQPVQLIKGNFPLNKAIFIPALQSFTLNMEVNCPGIDANLVDDKIAFGLNGVRWHLV